MRSSRAGPKPRRRISKPTRSIRRTPTTPSISPSASISCTRENWRLSFTSKRLLWPTSARRASTPLTRGCAFRSWANSPFDELPAPQRPNDLPAGQAPYRADFDFAGNPHRGSAPDRAARAAQDPSTGREAPRKSGLRVRGDAARCLVRKARPAERGPHTDRHRVDDDLCEVHALQAELFGQGIAQRRLGHEAQIYEELPDRLMGLELLEQRDPELILGEDSLRNQNLPDMALGLRGDRLGAEARGVHRKGYLLSS